MKTNLAPVTWWTFLCRFLRSPRSVGAVVPSSSWLVEALVNAAHLERAHTVVEFGPGTGVVTKAILRRLRPGARLVALELDEHFAEQLRHRTTDPRATILTGCATAASQHLDELGVRSVDCIISSLPLTSLPRPLAHRILKATRELLRPGGVFVTYQFSSATRSLLLRYFPQARMEQVVLRNFPPALVFVCPKEEPVSRPTRPAPELMMSSSAP